MKYRVRFYWLVLLLETAFAFAVLLASSDSTADWLGPFLIWLLGSTTAVVLIEGIPFVRYAWTAHRSDAERDWYAFGGRAFSNLHVIRFIVSDDDWGDPTIRDMKATQRQMLWLWLASIAVSIALVATQIARLT